MGRYMCANWADGCGNTALKDGLCAFCSLIAEGIRIRKAQEEERQREETLRVGQKALQEWQNKQHGL